jgi:hypothetical protein
VVRSILYVEGGGDSKELHARCREGFRKLLESCGFAGRMPRIVACGGRAATFNDFKTALSRSDDFEFVAMLIDSEQSMSSIEATWRHLIEHEGWQRPRTADDGQVLFMTTCMETWIVADRATLAKHFGSALRTSDLPPLQDLEVRDRQTIQESLEQATRTCSNAYRKGKRSFEVLGRLNPDVLELHLPSFSRSRRILNERL